MAYKPKEGTEHHQSVVYDSLKVAYLERLIADCKASKSHLVFIASPIYNPVSDVEFAALKNLCSKYNVPFIDHYCDPAFCKTPDFFADGGHLNRDGAELFTSIAASEIKSILMP